ncbi:FAD/NAD(P)-binding protein [Luteolibacter flavescens]|uniref:FAD/NAD(P)-binding protein n=1 Tax=Luteolibacter flavescens TaxID=1859460 RepID=A0ABT3FL23_9BACT|nr:FAD/NAD(P)-binding protein [Luteolibacter flavescens]MCW1884288.1 FAD/NAD(P)-binding protein [Luteolibacter flavescens]
MSTKRLAIIGAGSSGLVTLKHALERLPGWEITCFEKGGTTVGRWGNPYPGFFSTSTKYTTQFACHKKWDSSADPAQREAKGDFFKGDEYGRYLMDFVAKNNLAPHIHLHTRISRISRDPQGWRLTIDDGETREEVFDRLVICTGLAENVNAINAPIPTVTPYDPVPSGKTVVVFGGGESAADFAHRLADPKLGNKVYLSLKDGIRVSPRYHPIRGVPSDFLRNRLLLSIHPDLRNAIGQKFVEARIRHQEWFERVFKSSPPGPEQTPSFQERRKHWDAKLTARAKDDLFNVFHTKSDGFLDDVADGRIQIIGPPTDESHRRYHDFDRTTTVEVEPDMLCPMIGFRSGLAALSGGEILITDFHLACLHARHDDLFLVGFARPIIGNIPTMSEMQAKLVTGIMAGWYERPADLASKQAESRARLLRDFPTLNTETIHPVEMFPYCDELARLMGSFPSLRKVGSFRRWMKIQLSPASTLQYMDDDYNTREMDEQVIHTPPVITVLLVAIKLLLDLPYRLVRGPLARRHSQTSLPLVPERP